MRTYIKVIMKAISLVIILSVASCKKLTELNINPNGVTLQSTNPSLLMGGVLPTVANQYLSLGFQGGFSGVMQYMQKAYHNGDFNYYDWTNEDWAGYYSNLRNDIGAYDVAKERGNAYLMGEALIMKSFVFGFLTDIWGDIPYTHAIKGDQGGEDNLAPTYDDQQTVYSGILKDLKEAANLMSSVNPGEGVSDAYYHGDASKWAKFANSLRLRFYMRISSKLPDVAKEGIAEVYNSGIYFKSIDDEATYTYSGATAGASWPNSLKFDGSGGVEYRYLQMCQTFVDTLMTFNDPRLHVWADKVEIPFVISDTDYPDADIVVDGVRYIHSSAIPAGTTVNTDSYVGIPPAVTAPDAWNLNPTAGGNGYNPHVSHINSMYKEASGPLLKVRLQSYSEVCFIFAEAALKWGIAGGDVEAWYNKAVKASLDTWGVGDDYDNYISGPDVAFNGTLRQIMTQKWIANWTVSQEAWFDYRRTGYPDLKSGPKAERTVLPIRYMYPGPEYTLNKNSLETAVNKLEKTGFSGAQGNDSPWSKMWLLQGTSKPW